MVGKFNGKFLIEFHLNFRITVSSCKVNLKLTRSGFDRAFSPTRHSTDPNTTLCLYASYSGIPEVDLDAVADEDRKRLLALLAGTSLRLLGLPARIYHSMILKMSSSFTTILPFRSLGISLIIFIFQ